jgi:hypothetical protein
MKLSSYVPAGRRDSYMFPVREHYFSASEGLFIPSLIDNIGLLRIVT